MQETEKFDFIDAHMQKAISLNKKCLTLLQNGYPFDWIVNDLYYTYYHTAIALLYSVSDMIQDQIDAGRKIRHDAALKAFHHNFIGKLASYPDIFDNSIYDAYFRLKKLREETSYGTAPVSIENDDKSIDEILSASERLLYNAETFLESLNQPQQTQVLNDNEADFPASHTDR